MWIRSSRKFAIHLARPIHPIRFGRVECGYRSWFIGYFVPSLIFGFFCLMMVLQLIWIATMVPETKGVPLEEMEA